MYGPTSIWEIPSFFPDQFPLTLVICCYISAQHESVGVNLGQSVLLVATEMAWKMLFCHSYHSSKKMLPSASLCLCLCWLRLYLQKEDETGANHRRGAASVILYLAACVELLHKTRNGARKDKIGLLYFPSPTFPSCRQDTCLECVKPMVMWGRSGQQSHCKHCHVPR